VGLGTTDRWAPSLFYFQNQNQDPNLKFRRELFPASKIHEKSDLTEEIKGNNLSFGSNFKIKTDFELQIWKVSKI
jgi:hypothetical protein